MKGLSQKEVELIAWLEFHKKYFFTAIDINQHTNNKTQRYNIIKHLLKKGRIVKINRHKYYLIPIKAKSGSWTEDPFIIVDEICDGQDYMIGGWSAANYWRLTDQIPFQIDVYTTRRQGKIRILHTVINFHRTSKKRTKTAIIQSVDNHLFRIASKREARQWIKLHE